MSKILVVGGTGMLGKPVVQELAQAGFQITTLVRNKKQALKILPPNVTLSEGDLQNLQSLEKAFTNHDAVYINLNIKRNERPGDFHTEAEGLKNILTAAKKTHVKRIAFISSLVINYQGRNNFNWWVFDIKKQAVDLIRSSGIPYTIFYPSTFMESVHHNYRQGNNMMLAGNSLHKMYIIAANDYGKQVARSFSILKDENKEYTIQGPEGYTADEAVEEYVKHYQGAKLKIRKAPITLLKFLGIFSTSMNYGAHILEALNNYPEQFSAQETWEELGKPSTLLKDFVKKLP
ncbi:NAD(P)H-binding protein [Fulvivirgaceae bacterium PWU20]|uniref:NAD(P)H-binding protein n=1 Tax=Chryseosolibacter indicus TaxID=2782351 RepID=A0ABS5VTV2_9BACT|nr:NAD(P)H-binding protein [Chryseosolibacter indicus]